MNTLTVDTDVVTKLPIHATHVFSRARRADEGAARSYAAALWSLARTTSLHEQVSY